MHGSLILGNHIIFKKNQDIFYPTVVKVCTSTNIENESKQQQKGNMTETVSGMMISKEPII